MPPQPQAALPASAYPPANLREYNGDALRNVSYAFIFLVVAVVALRFYARTVSKSMIGLDDILILIAAIPAIAVSILCLVGEYPFPKPSYRHVSSRVHVDDAYRHPRWFPRTPLPRFGSGYSALSTQNKPRNTIAVNNAS